MSEFFGHYDTIVTPEKALRVIQAGGEKHKNWEQMSLFIKQHGNKFNPS